VLNLFLEFVQVSCYIKSSHSLATFIAGPSRRQT